MVNLAAYLTASLTALGYSGIAAEECGCRLGIDEIAPCDNINLHECRPGYVHYCLDCPRRPDAGDDCPLELGSLYCVSASKDWPSAQEVE